MKVLFISKYVPYNADSGITVRINNLLKCMNKIVDIACVFISENKSNADKILAKCNLDIKNIIIENKVSGNPFIRYGKHLFEILYVFRNIRSEIDNIIKQEKPDIIWLEFEYICHLIPFLKKYNKPIYYSSHNFQFELDFKIWKNLSGILSRVRLFPMLLFKWIHERKFFPMADRIFCISEKDKAKYKTFIPESMLGVLPFYFDDNEMKKDKRYETNKKYICLIGSLNSSQNYHAAVYMLTEIWPEIQKKQTDIVLYIIGKLPKVDSSDYTNITKLSCNYDNVKLTDKVESVIPYLSGAIVSVVPITIGSGVRTKIIESIACGTPVISTSIGAEGLPFEDNLHIYIADDPVEFANKVVRMSSDSNARSLLIKNAYDVYKSTLSLDAGVQKLQKIMNG